MKSKHCVDHTITLYYYKLLFINIINWLKLRMQNGLLMTLFRSVDLIKLNLCYENASETCHKCHKPAYPFH